ncbi:hypothetical protein B0H10DRAFT_1944642 [Mycena sp. CBHHK59/15]|nr:hypothetical protein B0H10DRAFT_1944642 [Mycena sp. CBHHK59/15]
MPYVTYTHAPALLQLLGATSLQSITISGYGETTELARSQDICALIAQKWAGTLKYLKFKAAEIGDVACVSVCTALETFRLTDCRTFSFGDFMEIALGWGSLQCLSIPSASGVDLISLARIAITFPRLLALKVDLVVDLTFLPHLSTTPVLSHILKRLLFHSFPPSCASDTTLLASHLHRLFPRLDSIRYGGRIGQTEKLGELAGEIGFEADVDVWVGVLEDVFRLQDFAS